MTAIQKAREALVAARESLTWGHESASALAKIDAALAALDAETPATPADVGEEPVAWRVEAYVSDASGKKRMNLYTERLPFHPGEGVKQLSKPEPLYSATALERVVRERDEARAEIERMTPQFVAYEYLESPAGREIAEAELHAVSAAIGSPRFMDPPDGGSVTLAEQVNRMREALESAEAKLAEARKVIAGWISAEDQWDCSAAADDLIKERMAAARRFLEETK